MGGPFQTDAGTKRDGTNDAVAQTSPMSPLGSAPALSRGGASPSALRHASNGLRIARDSYQIDSVSHDEVLRYLGYRGQALTEELRACIDAAATRCLDIARPRATMASYRIREVGEHGVALDGCTLHLTGRDITMHLADAYEVVLFAATLGADVDRELRRLALTDTLEQVLFDAVATALVERTADAAEARARAYAAEQNAFASWRFSPGYGDLPLSCQGDFLAALDATRQLGLTLTPSNLMIPTKSVTAVVGVHPTVQPGLESSCSICSLAEFCTIRQTGRTCRG